MNIIICDDDIIFCQEFKKQIQQVCENLTIKENIECFNDGISLKKYLEEYAIDILFLDIELDNLLGYEIGDYVRNILNLQKLEIVYVSHKPQYALSLFDTRPLNFLVKPVKNNSLEKVFQDFYKIHKNQKKVFEYKKGTSYHEILLEDILYFESQNKKIMIHGVKTNETYYGKLLDVMNLLENDFLCIHRSFLVNKEKIVQFYYDQVVLINGEVLPISQSKRQEIRKIQMKTWVNKNNE